MLILGVDTSGKHGSIALVRFESATSQPKAFNREGREEQPQSSQRTTSHTLEVVSLEGGTFSARLVPQISGLLQKHGLTKHQIDAFAVVTGPGSFTGLRVGLAAIKALADILQKPIAAVSLLEAIALAAGLNGRVLAVLDAGRGEVYVGAYDVQEAQAMCASEKSLSIAEFTAEAAGSQVVTTDPKIGDLLRQSGSVVHKVDPPRADTVTHLGYKKIQAGETVTPEALDATYIRRSEAEIKLSTTRG
jgi:tRNA threonylcarbamoyladenosine biosynthesis protein TsaB